MTAPQPEGEQPPNAVISVELDDGEEVRWVRTYVDGAGVVTGYEIVEKTDDGVEKEV